MRDIFYRLTTRHQKLDELLERERQQGEPDFTRIFRLNRMKQAMRRRLVRLIAMPKPRRAGFA